MRSPGLKSETAQSLRKRMTPAERHLWSKLRAYRFHGLKFQRQEPFGPYIVDFYCSVARLAIELDGDAHFFTRRADAVRQEFLEAEGVTVLRFPNFEVLHNTAVVLRKIHEVCYGHLVLGSNGGASLNADAFEEGTF